MSTTDQLEWEARLARPAALAAFAAGLLLLAGTAVLLSIPDGRPRTEARPDFLLSVNDSPGTLIAATALQAGAVLLLILVFYYLFRAVVQRAPGVPAWFVYLIFLGPVMYAAGQGLNASTQIDVAETFAGGQPVLGEPGDERADNLLDDNVNSVGLGLGLAGSVSVAFLFIMLPLRARRAGLLSPFMSILGVIAGVLLVLPLVPGVPVVIQAFWLGALGALYLGRWPGGRGPAWETGEADPWPSPAQRRGLTVPGGDEAEEPAAAEPQPEPVPERPSSRKRKRKRG